MSASTAEPLTRDAIDQFLSQLTDQQKRYVFVKLSGPILRPIKERRAFLDENRQWLGDFLPIVPVQPGQPVGMTDEEREELAKMPRISLEEARARRAKLLAELRAARAKSDSPTANGVGE